jgi:hypothetical protein
LPLVQKSEPEIPALMWLRRETHYTFFFDNSWKIRTKIDTKIKFFFAHDSPNIGFKKLSQSSIKLIDKQSSVLPPPSGTKSTNYFVIRLISISSI